MFFLFSRRINDSVQNDKDRTDCCISNITFLLSNAQKGPEELDQNVNNKSEEQEVALCISR